MREKIVIFGMTCHNCAQTIRSYLENIGLSKINIDFSSGRTTFDNPNKITLSTISKELKSIGYTVKLKVDNQKLLSVEKKFLFTVPFTLPLFSHMFFGNEHFLNNAFLQIALCLPVLITGLAYFGPSAWNSLKIKMPNMDVLIMTGSLSAFIYSIIGVFLYYGTSEMHTYLFFETTATIITLVLLGNVMESRSVRRTSSAIEELLNLQPQIANLFQNNKIIEVSVDEIKVDDYIQVNEGDQIPVDGIVIDGTALLNESMITGETLPVFKKKSDNIIAGTILLEGNIKMQAKHVGNKTALSSIIKMVEQAQTNKPSIQRIGDVVSSYFVPGVILIAISTFGINYFIGFSIQDSLLRSIAVMVISCPCAMGLATPTAVMVGLGRASKNGILIRGGNILETFSKTKHFLFDKTGTITTGKFNIKTTYFTRKKEEVNNLFFTLEQHSSHPIAKSIRKHFSSSKKVSLESVEELKGIGISAKDSNGNSFELGSKKICKNLNNQNNFDVFLLKNKELIAAINLVDDIKIDAAKVMLELKKRHLQSYILSGDKNKKCKEVAKDLYINEFFSEKTPKEKLQIIDSFIKKDITTMIGDGINDSPALAKADVGISLGNATQIAIQTADIVVLDENNLHGILKAFQISKHTLLTIKQNLFWAFSYNLVAIPVAAVGLLNPMWGALFMAFSDVIIIGNSIRLKYKKLS